MGEFPDARYDSVWHHYKQVLFARDYRRDVPGQLTHSQLDNFRGFLKLSMLAIQQLEAGSARRHVQALYGRDGEGWAVKLPTHHRKWLRLFGDDKTSLAATVIETDCLECEQGELMCHRLHTNHPIHQPGSVLSTLVYLVPQASLPKGLESYKHTGRVTPQMIGSVPAGAELDLGPHGTLRVLRHEPIIGTGGYALVVEWQSPYPQAARSVFNFWRWATGKKVKEHCHHERRQASEASSRCVPVLVVSDTSDKRIARWLLETVKVKHGG
jgi:hypothetical protein